MIKISVVEVEPFCGVNSSVKGEEEGVVELLVLDLGDELDEGK